MCTGTPLVNASVAVVSRTVWRVPVRILRLCGGGRGVATVALERALRPPDADPVQRRIDEFSARRRARRERSA